MSSQVKVSSTNKFIWALINLHKNRNKKIEKSETGRQLLHRTETTLSKSCGVRMQILSAS